MERDAVAVTAGRRALGTHPHRRRSAPCARSHVRMHAATIEHWPEPRPGLRPRAARQSRPGGTEAVDRSSCSPLAAAEAAVVVIGHRDNLEDRRAGCSPARVARRRPPRRRRRALRVGAARRHAGDVLPHRGRERAPTRRSRSAAALDEHAVDAPARKADDAARRRRRRSRRGCRPTGARRVGHAPLSAPPMGSAPSRPGRVREGRWEEHRGTPSTGSRSSRDPTPLDV